MSSAKYMGCMLYPTLGKLLAGMQMVIGAVLVILAPLVYNISYSYSSCHNDNTASWIVGPGGGLLFLAGIFLLMGIRRNSVCFTRSSISLALMVTLGLISCAIWLLVIYSEVGGALTLIFISVWLIISIGYTSRYGRAMILPPVEKGLAMAVVAPPPLAVLQPGIQHKFTNKTTYSAPAVNYELSPPQPPQHPHQQYSHSSDSANPSKELNYQTSQKDTEQPK